MDLLCPGAPSVPARTSLRLDQIGPNGTVACPAGPPVHAGTIGRRGLPAGHVAIQPGQNLWTIARHTYGQGIRYTVIYQANRQEIRNPDLIYPGQVFALPGATGGAAQYPPRRASRDRAPSSSKNRVSSTSRSVAVIGKVTWEFASSCTRWSGSSDTRQGPGSVRGNRCSSRKLCGRRPESRGLAVLGTRPSVACNTSWHPASGRFARIWRGSGGLATERRSPARHSVHAVPAGPSRQRQTGQA